MNRSQKDCKTAMGNGKLHSDRTGGSGARARVKPPVAHFSGQLSLKSTPPTPFKIDELGQHIFDRGFIDGKTEQSQYVLETIGYQHVSGYFDLFKDDNGNIIPGSSVKQLHRTILFDRKLQALLLEYIGLFELQFRARFSYMLSLKRGAFAHRNPKNFKDRKKFDNFLKRYGQEFNRQLKNRNSEITRAYDEYGDAPVWLAVEIMSFGTLSMLYQNTKSKEIREGVARYFGATAEELVSWTRALSSVRNICAHFNRLCGTKPVSRPKKIPGFDWDNSDPLYAVFLLLYLFRNSPVFDDAPSLAYNLNLHRDFVQLLTEFDDVFAICGITNEWLKQLFSKAVLGTEANIDLSEFQLDENIGRVSLSVRRDDGRVVEIGKYKK